VCASFSCELFLKYIFLVENGKQAPDTHSLLDLFNQCSKETQSALVEHKTEIPEIFKRNRNQFKDARYHHEKDCISFCQQELMQTAEVLSRFVKSKYPNGEST
jgi:HEPN domain-containing protein